MSYRDNFSLMIESVVQGMTFPVIITDIVQTVDQIDIEVCDLYHAEPGRTVMIGGNDYVIRSIDDSNNTMVLEPGPAITANTFNLYLPHFFNGTPLAVEKEVKEIPNAEDKTPMVFLLIPYKERIFEDPENSLDRRTTATLFFLTQANFDAWSTGDLQSNAVRPMERLQQRFIEAIKADSRFQNLNEEAELTPRVKFGVFITNKGVEKSFKAMDLSGVQMDRSYAIWKGCYAEDTCPVLQPISQFDNSFDNSFA